MGLSLPAKADDHYLVRSAKNGLRMYLSDTVTAASLFVFVSIVLMGIFGPWITPYPFDAMQTTSGGELARLMPPSSEFLLGTTDKGEDVFSRLIYGARPTLITGFLGGSVILSVGLTVGVVAGYYGGTVDSILMRITDFFYGLPIIPMAIVLVAFFGIGFWTSIFMIGLLLWRGNARVFRSQVLQIKQRPHVRAAKTLGASDYYVITRHILPNMTGMIFLFLALGIGVSILISASLAFLGVVDPFTPSWGIMLQNAYNSGLMTQAWWWAIPPGAMISLTVLSTYLLGRGYERLQDTGSEGVVAQ